nr:immunoglobulin light chain junction region [Macaca mulatta]MOW15214.1 immunoglobulin light chain junction region [Macaca mulatta]MOW15340.1 immunoglobulin light chain junction region [Macaca mulatta]MOW15624.1 immunoglobulin light chain junction region [Macaca mulatta]MOW17287.1 immunoglobulin light chain junction region [Macaca mulatta]
DYYCGSYAGSNTWVF